MLVQFEHFYSDVDRAVVWVLVSSMILDNIGPQGPLAESGAFNHVTLH